MTLEEFRAMVQRHDLTYSYSDDHRYWVSGSKSYAEIKHAAKQFNRADVVRVWNEVVDTKLVENARSSFYWKE